MKTAIIIILVLLMPAPAAAADKWSNQDKILEATYLTLMALDWGTTLDIAEHPQRYREYNPILGDHPTRGQVNTYFLASGIIHVAVTHLLRADCRPYWQGVTIGLTGICLVNNLSIGLKFAW
jgi:hypothetical protein